VNRADTSDILVIFDRMRPALTRFLIVRGMQPVEADDVLQDMFLRVCRIEEVIVEPGAYLYRMASNLALDVRRSAARRSARERNWIDLQASDAIDQDGRPTADQALLARERLKAIQDALQALPERTADIFRRYRLDGQPQKAIAGELMISVSAVEKHLQRAYRAVIAARADYDAASELPRRHKADGGDFGG
jgi:RNA polymerase sigma factor (sigma-70 family)